MAEGELADSATKLLLDDSDVKIWELNLKPGQSSGWLRHAVYYVPATI